MLEMIRTLLAEKTVEVEFLPIHLYMTHSSQVHPPPGGIPGAALHASHPFVVSVPGSSQLQPQSHSFLQGQLHHSIGTSLTFHMFQDSKSVRSYCG
jgi:hypothetical protein